MPALVDGMEEGLLVAWLVPDGSDVAVGDELLEVETDKATVTVASEHAGRVTRCAEAGASVPVGAVVATIGGQEPAVGSAPRPTSASGGSPREPRVSPVARRMAERHGIDLATVTPRPGSARIGRADVEAALAARGEGTVSTPSDADAPAVVRAVPAPPAPVTRADGEPADGDRGTVERVPLTRLQRTVTERMVAVQTTVPSFTVSSDVAMDACVALRREARDAGAAAPSYNDLVVKACAQALRLHPKLNGRYRDDALELHSRVNVGIAVAGDGTLLVPTLRDADRRSLADLSTEARRLALAAREGTVTPAELAGGTFTVSNLGMYGVDAFTAVINAPQAAILAVGALRESAPGAGGTRMTLTLTCDHRIVYGADAAAFLRDVRDRLERPMALLLA